MVISEINECSNFFCNVSSKMFLPRVYYGFAKTQITFEFEKGKTIEEAFFHENASSFLKGISNKHSTFIKSRCLPGVLFFARFSTWEVKCSSAQFVIFYPKLAKCFGFQTDVRSLSKKTGKRQNVQTDF